MGQMTCFNVREEIRFAMKYYHRSVDINGFSVVWKSLTNTTEFIEVVW